MPKRVLIVEDDETRYEWFRRRLSACDIAVTCDAARACELLARNEYDLILLDHDLLGEHYFSDEPDDERTGYAVAAWLAARPGSQPAAQIVIHSLNDAGAQRMLEALVAAGFDAECIPFHYLQRELRF
ncbi:MAG TPA: cyclic-phosphate processing receiver domain-containing protein [Pyrinomonadaceae bacterium]